MNHAPTDLSIDDETARILQRFGFDETKFAELCERLREYGLGPDANRVTGAVSPPAQNDVHDLPQLGSSERERLAQIGLEAIAQGQVGVVILAGGMATRFGGAVKAAVEAVDGHTFLDLKLRDVARRAEATGGTIPVYLMTSFATHEDLGTVIASRSTPRVPIQMFPQFVSLRLTPDAELFRGDDGLPSPYAPGHGDLSFAMRRAGFLHEFRNAGGELLFMSNVDNLGATLDPAVIGFHRASGCALTAEVVDKVKGDKGGAPARVGDTLQIVESFRFPASFDQDSIPVFNTNTFVLDAREIDRDFALTFFAVKKDVDGRAAVQFERLVGELTAFLPTAFLRVPRDGVDGRFQPVKDPEELEQRRDAIREILRARGVL